MNKYCTLKNSKLIWKIDCIKENTVYISIENKKIKTSLSNIVILDNYTPDNHINISVNVKSNNINEIMLRHKTKDEALLELDKFIDNAIVSDIPRIKIIHGKNGGIIRKAVHEYLNNCPYISSYNLGEFYEGSYGVTIAYIKRHN